MKMGLITLLLAMPLLAQATPQVDPFTPLRFLVGEWQGEGAGQPGQAKGKADYRFELDGKVLVRRNQADLPAGNGRPAARHEDLMTIFAEGGLMKALYLDNEGHVIRYLVTARPDGVVFTSEPAPGPRFRLSYIKKTETLVTVRFEIASPAKPEAFSIYLEADTRKTK
jgi:hypothetical protein